MKQNYMSVFVSLVSQCAEAGKVLAQTNAMVGDLQPLCLYFRASTTTANGELKLVAKTDKAPEGFSLVTDETLNIDVAYDNYFQWVHARSLRTNVLMAGLAT